jgi:hypothetical protein
MKSHGGHCACSFASMKAIWRKVYLMKFELIKVFNIDNIFLNYLFTQMKINTFAKLIMNNNIQILFVKYSNGVG